MAETIFGKAGILNKTNECIKEKKSEGCKELILQMEQMQIIEFKKNRFRCQSSILGLQTELIESYLFKNSQKRRNQIMIPYVIKNC